MTDGPPPGASPLGDGPWPGPTAYSGGDLPFVGREAETEMVASLLHVYHFVLLHAPSGAGKTSLVNAAVIPQLETDGFVLVGRARVNPTTEIAAARRGTGANPYELEAIETLEADDDPSPGQDLQSLLVHRSSVLDERGDLRPAVVVFDQFEEVLRKCEDYADNQERLMRAIRAAVEVRPNLHALFVVRDDDLGPVLRLGEQLGEDGFDAQFHLDQIRAKGAERLLIEPAERFGKAFDADLARSIVASLAVERYVLPSSTGGERVDPVTTSRYVSLVALQVVARQLWAAARDDDAIGPVHLTEIDGVEGAIRSYYHAAVLEACDGTATDEDTVRDAFEHQLISDAGQRQMVPRRAAAEALGGSDATAGARALAVLERHSLLRRLDHGPRYVELCHDSFVRPIRDANQQKRRDDRAARDRRRRTLVRRWSAAAGALIAVLAAVTIVLLQREPETEIVEVPATTVATLRPVELQPQLPDVTGRDRRSAEDELAGLGVTVTVERAQSTQPPGIVLSQTPPAGTKSENVVLQVSVGGDPLLRDDGVVLTAGQVGVVDVLANDEPGVDGRPLAIAGVEADDGIDASVVPGGVEVRTRDAGTFDVRYSVVGPARRQTATLTVTVAELTAAFLSPAEAGTVGEPIGFIDDSTGSVVERRWDFGDGATGEGASVRHVYGEPGTYTVELTVVDERGGTATATATVEIGEPDPDAFVWTLGEFFSVPRLGEDPVRGSGCGLATPMSDVPDGTWFGFVTGIDTSAQELVFDLLCVFSDASYQDPTITEIPQAAAALAELPGPSEPTDFYVVNLFENDRIVPLSPSFSWRQAQWTADGCIDPGPGATTDSERITELASWLVVEDGEAVFALTSCGDQ